MQDIITYAKTTKIRENFLNSIKELISRYRFKTILDIGGDTNPTLPLEFISINNLDYTVLDMSKSELDKASSQYKRIICDVTKSNLDTTKKYDFIFSQLLSYQLCLHTLKKILELNLMSSFSKEK